MDKIQIKKWIIKMVLLFAVSACMLVPETASAQTSGEFSIHAVIPDNQLDKKQTYFDLRMNPGDEQTIEVVITNSRAEELVVSLQLNNASTSRNGLIVYTEPAVRDESLKIAVTDVADLKSQKVTVPPLSSQTVTIDLKMPKEPFSGVILGGITATAVADDEQAEETQGVSLKNTITYVVALKLTENNDETTPDFDLTAITPGLVNHRTALAVTLSNKAPRIVKGMAVHAQVYRKGSDTVLHELILDEAEMAPLSTGDFVIDWENEKLQQGTYRLRMTADYEGRTWEWDEEFILGLEANNLNDKAVGIEKDYRWHYLLFGAAITLVLVLMIILIGKRKKNDNRPAD